MEPISVAGGREVFFVMKRIFTRIGMYSSTGVGAIIFRFKDNPLLMSKQINKNAY